MRVEVDREVATMMLNVYVIEDGIEGIAKVWTPLDEKREWTDIPLGGQAPVSLRIPQYIWVAILAAGADIPAPSRAQHDHLADTIAVRDKLLALVESSHAAMLPLIGPPRMLTPAESAEKR